MSDGREMSIEAGDDFDFADELSSSVETETRYLLDAPVGPVTRARQVRLPVAERLGPTPRSERGHRGRGGHTRNAPYRVPSSRLVPSPPQLPKKPTQAALIAAQADQIAALEYKVSCMLLQTPVAPPSPAAVIPAARRFDPDSGKVRSPPVYEAIASTSAGTGISAASVFPYLSADRSSPEKILARAVARFNALSQEVRESLPVVNKAAFCALMTDGEFVDLNDLLPRNCTPHPTGEKQIVLDPATNQLKTKSQTAKKDTIDSMSLWTRCWSTFTQYQSAVKPSTTIPMAKHLDQMHMLADPRRNYSLAQLLSYDQAFRAKAASCYPDLTIWTRRNEQAYLEFLDSPARTPAATSARTSGRQESRTCFNCSQPGHIESQCPERKDRLQSFVGSSPFPARPGATGADNSTQYCHNDAGGGCWDGPTCNMAACTNACTAQATIGLSIAPCSNETGKINDPVIPNGIVTPLKLSGFRKYLSSHPDQQFSRKIFEILTYGASVGFDGIDKPRVTPNAKTARDHADVLTKSINTEVSLQHSVGPFAKPPFPNFVVSSLGVRPKKNGKFRIILDLSRPFGDSVNDAIDLVNYPLTFCNVDDAIALLLKNGKGSYMAKFDIQHAFRLIPVRPQDWHLLGYQAAAGYFFDIVLPFGLRSSPYLFCLFSEAVRWILCLITAWYCILVYMDDFLLVAPTRSHCRMLMDSLEEVCLELGVPLAVDKTAGPDTEMIFVGIKLDSVAQTLSLPEQKYNEILQLVQLWLPKTHCSRTELQSLTGSLVFASKCVPAGRLFTRRLYAMLSESGVSGTSKPHSRITLDEEFKKDLLWWAEFLPKWNGTTTFLEVDWTRSDVLSLFTDASTTTGFGVYFNGSWFYGSWPAWLLDLQPSIEVCEMLPILLGLSAWKETLRNKRILFHCDNLGVVQAWDSLKSRSPAVLHLMRQIVAVAAENNFTISVKHIPGVNNCLADALSRFQLKRFRQLAPNAAPYPSPIPNIFPALRKVWRRAPTTTQPFTSSKIGSLLPPGKPTALP